jgi:hypothetical protein
MPRAYVSFLCEIEGKSANAFLDLLGQVTAKGLDEVYLLLSSAGGRSISSADKGTDTRSRPPNNAHRSERRLKQGSNSLSAFGYIVPASCRFFATASRHSL